MTHGLRTAILGDDGLSEIIKYPGITWMQMLLKTMPSGLFLDCQADNEIPDGLVWIWPNSTPVFVDLFSPC